MAHRLNHGNPTLAVDLQYQNRGGYSEGIKLNPVGGSDIELICVRAGYKLVLKTYNWYYFKK